MGKQSTVFRDHSRLRKLARGFSLVELMVALAIAGFLSIGLWALMGSQNKTYAVQDDASQMQQNLRAAINMISADLRTAGQGPPWQMTMDGKVSAWYAQYPAANKVNFGQPYSYVANSKQLDIIGAIGSAGTGGNQTTLSVAAAAGQNQITVAPAGQGQYFPVGTYIDIGDAGCYESAKVTAVAGDKLTVDTTPGANKPLLNNYAQGSSVCVLQWVTYSVNTAVSPTELRRDQHNGSGAQAVAYNITDLNAPTIVAPTPNPAVLAPPVPGATPDGGSVQITLTGSTGGAKPVQSTTSNIIRLRNP